MKQINLFYLSNTKSDIRLGASHFARKTEKARKLENNNFADIAIA